MRRLAEQGNHCDHHRDLGGIWNLVAIAIAGERIVSEFSPDLPGIPTCDTPTRLCAEPRSRARRLGSRPFLAEMSTDPESSLRVLYAYGANSKILTLAYFLFSNELRHTCNVVQGYTNNVTRLCDCAPRVSSPKGVCTCYCGPGAVQAWFLGLVEYGGRAGCSFPPSRAAVNTTMSFAIHLVQIILYIALRFDAT